jgi:hypothetical protein
MFGIMGDLALAEYDTESRGLAARLGGPAMSKILAPAAAMGSRLIWDQKADAPLGLEAMRTARDLMPFGNMIFGKQALDYLFWWSLQEAIQPASIQRQEQSLRSRTGQEYYPGRSPSEHYPLFQ